MLRKLMPLLTVILSVLLDTAVFPLIYGGVFQLSLSLVVVILIGIQLGRMRGMLYGMIAGLLLDVSAGSLGIKLFGYIGIGFLIGFLLDQQPSLSRTTDRRQQLHILFVRAVWIAVLIALYEVVLLVFQYFHTAIFHWLYVRNLLLRVLALTLAASLLYPLFHKIYIGKKPVRAFGRNAREVKNF